MNKFKYHGRLITASSKKQAIRKIVAASPRKFRQPDYMRDGGKDPDFKGIMRAEDEKSLEKKIVDFYDHAESVIESKVKGVYCRIEYEASDGSSFGPVNDHLIREKIVQDVIEGKECWMYVFLLSFTPSSLGFTGKIPPEVVSAFHKGLGNVLYPYGMYIDGSTDTPGSIYGNSIFELSFADLDEAFGPKTQYVCRINDIKANKGKMESDLKNAAGQFEKIARIVVSRFKDAMKNAGSLTGRDSVPADELTKPRDERNKVSREKLLLKYSSNLMEGLERASSGSVRSFGKVCLDVASPVSDRIGEIVVPVGSSSYEGDVSPYIENGQIDIYPRYFKYYTTDWPKSVSVSLAKRLNSFCYDGAAYDSNGTKVQDEIDVAFTNGLGVENVPLTSVSEVADATRGMYQALEKDAAKKKDTFKSILRSVAVNKAGVDKYFSAQRAQR